jgi:ABC-2 type transport system ATP-binding protein
VGLDMIEAENLTRKFGDLTAVDNLTFKVDEGEIFGFLGPNGAGKTTTVRMLCCLISKTSGKARVGGYEVGNDSDSMQIRKLIGLLPENVGLYEQLSAAENLDFFGRLYEVKEHDRRERIGNLLNMLGLWEKRDVPAGTLSKGMKQKLAISRALIHDPKVLFLDEPTANLDPESSRTVREFILELKKQKRTIFLNTHNLDEAQRICDRIGILKTRLLTVGTPDQLEASLWGRKTVVQLVEVNDAILNALKGLGPKNIVVEDSRLVIDVTDPKRENPSFIEAIVSAGGRIQFVTERIPSLEDFYLRTVGSAK